MKLNKNILISIIVTIVLIPFRLPVNVLLIKIFTNIAQVEGTILPIDLLVSNIMVTKFIYDGIFMGLLIRSIVKLIKPYTDKWTANADIMFYIFVVGGFTAWYIIYDIVTVKDLATYILKL